MDDSIKGAGGLHEVMGRAIRIERTRRRLTQSDLAQQMADLGAVSLTRNAIASIEAGTRKVDLQEAYALCDLFDISLGRLLLRGEDGRIDVFDNDRPVFMAEVANALEGSAEPEEPAEPAEPPTGQPPSLTWDDLSGDQWTTRIRTEENAQWVRDVVADEMRGVAASIVLQALSRQVPRMVQRQLVALLGSGLDANGDQDAEGE